MSKERDVADFRALLRRLEAEGRIYEKGDSLTESLGGERFSYKTRSIVSDMVDIMEENEELAEEIPEKLRMFFEGYVISRQWPRITKEVSMNRISMLVERVVARTGRELSGLDNGDVRQSFIVTEDGKRHPIVASERNLVASGDLGDVKKLLDAMHKKQAEFERKKEEYLRETNRMWDEATRDVDVGIRALLDNLYRELMTYFKESGMGVRNSSNRDGLIEVFVGSGDGVERRQSKVSVLVHLTFEGRENAYATLANENLDEWVSVPLKDEGTVSGLLATVIKAKKKGFWKEGGV